MIYKHSEKFTFKNRKKFIKYVIHFQYGPLMCSQMVIFILLILIKPMLIKTSYNLIKTIFLL